MSATAPQSVGAIKHRRRTGSEAPLFLCMSRSYGQQSQASKYHLGYSCILCFNIVHIIIKHVLFLFIFSQQSLSLSLSIILVIVMNIFCIAKEMVQISQQVQYSTVQHSTVLSCKCHYFHQHYTQH